MISNLLRHLEIYVYFSPIHPVNLYLYLSNKTYLKDNSIMTDRPHFYIMRINRRNNHKSAIIPDNNQSATTEYTLKEGKIQSDYG